MDHDQISGRGKICFFRIKRHCYFQNEKAPEDVLYEICNLFLLLSHFTIPLWQTVKKKPWAFLRPHRGEGPRDFCTAALLKWRHHQVKIAFQLAFLKLLTLLLMSISLEVWFSHSVFLSSLREFDRYSTNTIRFPLYQAGKFVLKEKNKKFTM